MVGGMMSQVVGTQKDRFHSAAVSDIRSTWAEPAGTVFFWVMLIPIERAYSRQLNMHLLKTVF